MNLRSFENYIANRNRHISATHTYQSAIKASGPLLRLPAGLVQLTVGLDWRRTHRYRMTSTRQYEDGLTGEPRVPVGSTSPGTSETNSPNLRYKFDSYALYAEATVPLLSDAQGLRLVENLELFASGRVDRNVRNGFRSQSTQDLQNGVPPVPVRYTRTTNIYAYGLRYEILEGVVLRASQSIGFRPPQLTSTIPDAPPTRDLSNIYDPVRDELVTIYSTMYLSGGNPDLRPETTNSINIGMVLTPPWLRGTRLSVDYLQNIRNDAIFGFGGSASGAQRAIDLEGEKPGLVFRDSPDGHPSGVGPITFLDLRITNLHKIQSKSVDISLTQELRNVLGGHLTLTAAVTRNISFAVQTTPDNRGVEQVRNVLGNMGQHIEWNGNAQLHWQRASWSVGWNARYFDYLLLADTYHTLQGADRAPWAVNHDLNIGYRAPHGGHFGPMSSLLAGTSITFGVKNVFNREPRFWARSINQQGIAPYDSIMGRSLWLNLRRDFGQ